MHHEQKRCDKQEGELNRLGYADQQRGQRRRDQNRFRNRFTLWLRGHVHRQRGGGKAEHFADAARIPHYGAAELLHVRAGHLGEVDIARALINRTAHLLRTAQFGIQERRIDQMMQARRHQNAFKETVDRHAKRTGPFDRQRQGAYSMLCVRPEFAHDHAEQHRDRQHHNRDKAVAGVNRHRAVKLDTGIFVVQITGERPGQDPGENAHLQHLDAQHHALSGGFHLFRRGQFSLKL